MKRLLVFFFLTSALYAQESSWQWINPVPTGARLTKAIFGSDRTSVWVIGSGGTILFSPDTGLTWQTIVPTTPTVCPDLNDIQFVDSLHGWIVGDGVVLSTWDG